MGDLENSPESTLEFTYREVYDCLFDLFWKKKVLNSIQAFILIISSCIGPWFYVNANPILNQLINSNLFHIKLCIGIFEVLSMKIARDWKKIS